MLFTIEQLQAAKHRDRLLLQCKHCSKEFYKLKRHIVEVLTGKGSNSAEYCSLACYGLHTTRSILVACKQCGKEISRTQAQMARYASHFCSSSCAATWNNRHKRYGYRRSKAEKWFEQQLSVLYPQLEIHFNRKDAIDSELDIYIPSLKLAFEINGIFHYEPIYGATTLGKIVANDANKFQRCQEQGISLCIIDISALKYFKPVNAQKYLDIITKIIDDTVIA